ncbi:MAG: hypothetical protein ABI988_20220 [Nitrospirota bacterium]
MQRAGLIEADEPLLDEPAQGKTGLGVANAAPNSLVVGAVEDLVDQDKQWTRRERAGRLRLRLIPGKSKGFDPFYFFSQNLSMM